MPPPTTAPAPPPPPAPPLLTFVPIGHRPPSRAPPPSCGADDDAASPFVGRGAPPRASPHTSLASSLELSSTLDGVQPTSEGPRLRPSSAEAAAAANLIAGLRAAASAASRRGRPQSFAGSLRDHARAQEDAHRLSSMY
jgi:hypothetical protein